MKHLRSLLFMALLCSGCTAGGQTPSPTPSPTPLPTYNVTVTWGANPPSQNVISYILYERFGLVVFTYTQVRVIAAPLLMTILTNVPAGPHTWVLTAVNLTNESPYSLSTTATVPITASAPTGLTSTVTKGP